MHGADGGLLIAALVFLAAAVVSAPLMRLIGLSPIVGYLIAGVALGPWGFGVFRDPERVLTISEIGVVLLLFIIGLELQVSRLLALRKAIFGLGSAQLLLTGLAIGLVAYFSGYTWQAAVVAGLALSLSATSIALQLLGERGAVNLPYGQRAFAVLLFQDMAVVPLLALVPLLAPTPAGGNGHTLLGDLGHVGLILAAVATVVLAGRYCLTPMFRILATSGAREAMTAAALLVVLGSAALMASVGMSMALGAFLAGLLLAESSFRHELEANIDAFRGLLLALFFMSVGMSIDVDVVLHNAPRLIGATILVTLLKALVVWGIFRAAEGTEADAVRSAAVLTSAGEFSFVLFPLALSLGVLTSTQSDMLAACAAMSMMLGPPLALLAERIARRLEPKAGTREADDFSDAHGSVIVVGFGRFGQIVSQCLLARGLQVTIIDNDVEMIQSAGRFGVHIYYGDGTRLEVLRAAGASQAQVVAICVDQRESANRIVEIARTHFPGARVHVRSYDRAHTLALRAQGVDYEIRETFESALIFGGATLRATGLSADEVTDTMEEVRTRDTERLLLQQEGGIMAGIDTAGGRLEPEPLTEPDRAARPLNPEAEDVLRHETEFSG